MSERKLSETQTAEAVKLSDLLACSECGKKSDDVVFCDMSNHPFYSKDDTEIPLCEKCYERLWDQI